MRGQSTKLLSAINEEYGVALDNLLRELRLGNFKKYWNLVNFSDGAFSGFKPLGKYGTYKLS